MEQSNNYSNNNNNSQSSASATPFSPGNFSRHNSRPSVDAPFPNFSSSSSVAPQSATTPLNGRPTSLQVSYSTSDVPTFRNGNGYQNESPTGSSNGQGQTHNGYQMPHTPHSTHSVNTTPPTPQSERNDSVTSPPSLQPAFQPNSVPFSSQMNTPTTVSTSASGAATPSVNSFPNSVYGYGLHSFPTNPLQTNGNHVQAFPPQPPFNQSFVPYSRFVETPARPSQVRRNGEAETGPFSRFANVPLEHYRGELYGLCKDQHGCRYLQRKLEERIPENVQMIFLEIHMHVVELMTG